MIDLLTDRTSLPTLIHFTLTNRLAVAYMESLAQFVTYVNNYSLTICLISPLTL